MKNDTHLTDPSKQPEPKYNKTEMAVMLALGLLVLAIVAVAISPKGSTNVSQTNKGISRSIGAPPSKSGGTLGLLGQAQNAQVLSQSKTNDDGTITPGKIITAPPVKSSVGQIMALQATQPARTTYRIKPEHEMDPGAKTQNPNAPATSQYPPLPSGLQLRRAPTIEIHTTAASPAPFDGATLTDTGAFPPDTMGTAGPTQYFAFENGRLRTFNKTTGVADGVVNADPDVFFASVMTPVSPPVLFNFTSDPNVRYDRFSARWFLTIIDVPCTNATCTTTASNRLLIAVSDAASMGTISGSTVWTFYQFQGDSSGLNFLDYPSLGIDVNALYIGGDMFTNTTGTFVGTNGYVVQKSSVLSGGPATVSVFANMALGAGTGPESPRGVDNFDPGATEGYFVGPDNAVFSAITFRRVSNPGSASPTISANIVVTVSTTTSPDRVEHLGNTGGSSGNLDSINDRFFQAMIRNGRLWSAHNFRVDTSGVASTAAQNRNASRWYEFQDLTTTPTVVQSGTVFDNAATRAAARQYFFPSIAVNGQGHAVMGFTMAGLPVGATPAYVGRLAGDTLGTMVGPPGTPAVTFGTTTANYNPPSDPGGANGRRWGDYSFTVVDPIDDMSIWTIQEYNQASNSYAVRVAKLLAPPPATPTCSGSPISFTGPTGNVVINATSSGGSGFYDPGANLAAPALPFSHLSATVTNATVNSVTFNSPTQATLNITATANGPQNVTITNPDGQSVTANGCINVSGVGAVADLGITKTDGVVTAVPGGSVTYTITASNATATAATGATVADTFPAVLSCTWTCVGAGGGTCTAAGSGNLNDTVNLPAGASVTYTATCAINASATGTLSNTATVTLAGDPNAANNSATDTDTLTPQANLGITKTDGVTTATPGGSVTYTITASNAGPSNAPVSTVVDTFPASLTCTWTCVGAGGGTCTASGSGNISDATNLPAGGSVTYTASCTISASATGSLSNTATVATSGGVTDPTPGNNSATDTDTLAAQADLAITKTDGVTTATPGGSTTYTITASNAGPSNATGATVADTFPASLTCTWTCVGAGGGTCTASGSGNISDTANLPAGGSVTYTASCTISASATGTLSNTATVAAPGGVTDPTPGNNSATDTDTLAAQANLGITKTDGVTTATPGGSVTYTITASNAGPSNAPGSTVADTFPASLTCTWTCTGAGGGTCTASGSGNINDTVNLPAGGSVTYTASCSISASATGSLSNTATVTAPGGVTDPTPGNNSATDTDTLSPQANLGITKTDGVTTATPGGSVTYTITASNAGPSNAPGSTVADTFPASLTCTWTCVGAGGGTCTASGSGNINDTANLPAGGSVTYTASCSIAASATGTLSNTATVATGGGITDPTPGNNSATDTDTLNPSANLGITKTDGVTTVTPGGSTTYTIVASNAGPSNVTGATVADTFPASLTCSWTSVAAGGATGNTPGPVAGNINNTGLTLPAGSSVTYTATCTISGSASGTISNTATVSSAVTDPNPANNSATDNDTVAVSADLAITKTDGVTTATPGGSTTYTIVASNAGPSTATSATVADTFPASLTCSWTSVAAGGATGNTTGPVVGNINNAGLTLPAGSSVTYTASCTISPSATGSLANTATVSSAVTDPNPANNSATDTDTLNPSADLSITKTDGVTTYAANGTVTYTIVVSNAGPSQATGAVVTDNKPTQISQWTWVCSGATGGATACDGVTNSAANFSDTVTLPAGSTLTYTVTATIGAAPSGNLVNTATVAAPGGTTDPNGGNNSATDTDTLTVGVSAGVLTGNFSDPLACTGPGNVVTGTIQLTNPNGTQQAFMLNTNLTNLVALPGSCTVTGGVGASCAITPGGLSLSASGNIPANGTITVQYQAQVTNVATGTVLTASSTATVGGVTATPNPLVFTAIVNCPAVGPGVLFPDTAEVSDQKAGSVLVYNLYSSSIAAPNAQNTRISITNTHPGLAIAVHLFFVDGATCSIADSLICLTPNQTASFLASDIDPGTTGYIVAVASDRITGCPINFNYLIGDAYVKLSSGHAANLAAEGFAAIAGGLATCNPFSVTALLSFDGTSYNRAPRVLAASNIPSRADGNDTLIVLNRVGGSLAAGASTLGSIFGILYDDAENPLSFTFTAGVCQFRSSLSSSFPRVAPRFEQFVPAGRSSWAKFYSQSDIALLGAQLNFNANAGTAANAFNQGHNLHKLTLTSAATLTIPIFPPNC